MSSARTAGACRRPPPQEMRQIQDRSGAAGRHRNLPSSLDATLESPLPTSPRSLNRQARLHRLLKQLHGQKGTLHASADDERGADADGQSYAGPSSSTAHAAPSQSHRGQGGRKGGSGSRGGRGGQSGRGPNGVAPRRSNRPPPLLDMAAIQSNAESDAGPSGGVAQGGGHTAMRYADLRQARSLPSY